MRAEDLHVVGPTHCHSLPCNICSQGLKPSTLTLVRRLTNACDALSAHAGALSVLFSQTGRTFLVSTDDCNVHQCRTAFGERPLRSFRGHLGPVYRVQESPFVPDLFLTASEDWTVRLWSQAKVGSAERVFKTCTQQDLHKISLP